MKPYRIPQKTPMFVMDGLDLKELDIELSDLERDFNVREIDITFKQEKLHFSQVRSSQDAYTFIKDVIFDGLEIQEHFIVLYMNQSNRIIGYYKHSKGTINSTQVDIQLVTAVAIKTLAKGMILSHNHPSGNTTPSQADRIMTKKLKDAAGMFDITVLDHIIATTESYHSFADSGDQYLSGNDSGEKEIVIKLRKRVMEALKSVTQVNSPNVFAQIQDQKGYHKMEELILEKVLKDNRIPEAVIPQIEMQWQ